MNTPPQSQHKDCDLGRLHPPTVVSVFLRFPYQLPSRERKMREWPPASLGWYKTALTPPKTFVIVESE